MKNPEKGFGDTHTKMNAMKRCESFRNRFGLFDFIELEVDFPQRL